MRSDDWRQILELPNSMGIGLVVAASLLTSHHSSTDVVHYSILSVYLDFGLGFGCGQRRMFH